MTSTLVLNMADPGVKSMVDGWADNTEYELTVKVKTGAGESRNVAVVTAIEQEDATEEAAMDEEMDKPSGMSMAEEPEPPAVSKPSIKIK